jgi:hypothetical protein
MSPDNSPITQESMDHPTPASGAGSTIYYRDDNGDPVDKMLATRAEIVEFDSQGNAIHRTYAEIRTKPH